MHSGQPRALDDLLWLLPLGFGLVALQHFGRLLPDSGVIMVWSVMTLLIGSGAFMRVRVRRRAWLEAYVAAGSPLRRWLRGGALLLLTRLLLAGGLAAVLFVSILRLHAPVEVVLLLVSLLLLVGLRALATRTFGRHVSAHYLPESAWRFTLTLTFVALCAALMSLAMWRPGPDFAHATLEQAAWHLAIREEAASPLLLQALSIAAALEGVSWWLAQHALPRLEWPLLQWLAWLLVLAKSALFVWAWLHCCVGTMLLPTLWKRADAPSQ